MASADLRDELNCSICLNIYTDPVTLPCGHNYCQGCIGNVLGTQEGSGVYSCPECRAEFVDRPALQRNRKLGNIAERFLSTRPERNDGTGISCTYCIHSPVPAVKSCLHCEASLCDNHLKVHSKSGKHVLTEPTSSFGEQKCSVHDELLVYYCPEDYTCVCVSCCLAGEHRGHQVALLSEAFENMKVKLGNAMGTLTLKREETERKVQVLQEHRREVEGKAAAETERVSALFRDIREYLESLEKRVLGEISRQEQDLLQQLLDLIQQIEKKKDDLSRQIWNMEELYSMADPLTFIRESEVVDCDVKVEDSLTDAASAAHDLDVVPILETLFEGLQSIVRYTQGGYCVRDNGSLLLDINTANKYVTITNNSKTAIGLPRALDRHETSQTFKFYNQVFSTMNFHSGRHYWEVKGHMFEEWRVGVAYPSTPREGEKCLIGNNDKSWALNRIKTSLLFKKDGPRYLYSVIHGGKEIKLSYLPSELNYKIRIFLDYEAGRLSFYELSDPVRHLHTFTVTFTEPLHPAFWVGNGWIVIND